MGCGHSKINIYPRKSRSKSNNKKSVIHEKTEVEEEDGVDNESENCENLEDCDPKKTIKVKPFGGPLLAQTEISNSQQDFFKMLDEKIQNGPDYNSESETEKAAEVARLSALLKDWETASAGSRSLPATPKRRPKVVVVAAAAGSAVATTSPAMVSQMPVRSDGVMREMPRPPPTDRAYISQIPPSVIHQSYGVSQVQYRQINYNNPNYISQSPSHQVAYPSALQYQAISPMYSNQPAYQQPPQPTRQYPSYNQHGSPIKSYMNPSVSPKHIPYDQPTVYSPSHKLYGPPVVAMSKQMYSNGELMQQQQQQQIYNNYHPQPPPQQHHHHHHQMQYQQYKEAREQVMAQHQPVPHPQSYSRSSRNYQSSVSIPVVKNQQGDMNSMHRKQYELT